MTRARWPFTSIHLMIIFIYAYDQSAATFINIPTGWLIFHLLKLLKISTRRFPPMISYEITHNRVSWMFLVGMATKINTGTPLKGPRWVDVLSSAVTLFLRWGDIIFLTTPRQVVSLLIGHSCFYIVWSNQAANLCIHITAQWKH